MRRPYRREVKPEHLVKLAAMECFASCVLTYVRCLEMGYPVMMPDYWNLTYQFKTLLSSKDARQMDLAFQYGIGLEFRRGSDEPIQEALRSGQCVILLCAASKLPYFPASHLGFERSGFQHCILLYDWDAETAAYGAADPMVGYIGTIGREELVRSGMRNDTRKECIYFVLKPPPEQYERPSPEKLFAFCSERNLWHFDADRIRSPRYASARSDQLPDGSKQSAWAEWFGNRNGGCKALDRFAEDLAASRDWSDSERSRWIARNQLTVTSIWKVRQQVWDGFCGLGVLSAEQKGEGKERLRRLLRLWQSFNFRLGRCGHHRASSDGTEAVRLLLEQIREEELRFLTWMNDRGEEAERSVTTASERHSEQGGPKRECGTTTC